MWLAVWTTLDNEHGTWKGNIPPPRGQANTTSAFSFQISLAVVPSAARPTTFDSGLGRARGAGGWLEHRGLTDRQRYQA